MQGQAQSQYPLTEAGYRIVTEIGHGGSARVYEAECIPTGETVAIKSVDLDRAGCTLEDVRKEARTMSLLDHPNVVRAHCSFGAGQALWVVMPYMAGGSCQSIMQSSDAFRHGFDETIIAAVLHQTLLGLHYLHAQGHIHRDIKCGNILMDSRGVVKLGDFGVSASVFDTGDRRARRMTFVGTPCWMAPEVIESESGGVSVNLNSGYDQKADIWSLGITALELAQGHAPLSEMPPMKALLMQLRGAMPPVLDNKRFSKNFRDIVASCLVRDPSRRPSAEKLLKHHFFKHVKGGEYLVRHVLDKVPSLSDRARVCKEVVSDEEFDDKKQRRISGWNFSEHDAKLENFNPNTSAFQFPSNNNIVLQAENNPNTTDVAESSSKNDHVVDSPKPSSRPLARTSSKLSLALSSSKSNLKDFFDSAKGSPKEMNGGAVVGQSPTRAGALDRKSSEIFDIGQSPRRGLEILGSGIPDAESPTRGGGGLERKGSGILELERQLSGKSPKGANGGGGGCGGSLERKGSGILELERQLSGKSPKGANGGGGLERKDSLVHKKGRFKITEENIIGNDNNKNGGVDVIHPLPPLRRMHSLSSHPSLSSPTASKLSNLNGRSVDKEVAPEAPLPGSPRCPSNVVMKHLQSLLESTATQRVLLKQLMNSMGVEEVSGEGALDKKVKELEALVASVTQELQDVKARNAHLEERLGNICRQNQ